MKTLKKMMIIPLLGIMAIGLYGCAEKEKDPVVVQAPISDLIKKDKSEWTNEDLIINTFYKGFKKLETAPGTDTSMNIYFNGEIRRGQTAAQREQIRFRNTFAIKDDHGKTRQMQETITRGETQFSQTIFVERKDAAENTKYVTVDWKHWETEPTNMRLDTMLFNQPMHLWIQKEENQDRISPKINGTEYVAEFEATRNEIEPWTYFFEDTELSLDKDKDVLYTVKVTLDTKTEEIKSVELDLAHMTREMKENNSQGEYDDIKVHEGVAKFTINNYDVQDIEIPKSAK